MYQKPWGWHSPCRKPSTALTHSESVSPEVHTRSLRWPGLSLITPICSCCKAFTWTISAPGVLCPRFWEMTDGFKVQLKTTLEVTCTCLLCCAAYINFRAVKTCKLPNSRLSSLCRLLLTALLICGSHLSLRYSSPYSAASATCSEEKGGQRALTAPRRRHPGQRVLLWWRRRWRRRPGGCWKPWDKA